MAKAPLPTPRVVSPSARESGTAAPPGSRISNCTVSGRSTASPKRVSVSDR